MKRLLLTVFLLVAVNYTSTGKLMGLFPVEMKVKATVSEDGTVLIDYPWYSSLVAKDEDEITQGLIKELKVHYGAL